MCLACHSDSPLHCSKVLRTQTRVGSSISKLRMAKTKATCIRSQALPSKMVPPSRETSHGESESPKAVVVGDYVLDTLPASWDNTASIRDRIRCGQNLLVRWDPVTGATDSSGFVEACNDNLKVNADVLTPLLVIMKDQELQLPSISTLLHAIEGFYTLSKISRSEDLIYQEAWAVRRMIGRMKKHLYRNFPPQDSQYQTNPCNVINHAWYIECLIRWLYRTKKELELDHHDRCCTLRPLSPIVSSPALAG